MASDAGAPGLYVPFNPQQYQSIPARLDSTVTSFMAAARDYEAQAGRAIATFGAAAGGLRSYLDETLANIREFLQAVDEAAKAVDVPPLLFGLKDAWLSVEQRMSLVGNGI